MFDKPILITGCARSGTSMTAGSIDICGAWGGETSGPNKNNKRGMFENAKIRNGIVKPFFRSMGVDPLGQNPLPDIEAVKLVSNEFIKEWRNKVHRVLVAQGYRDELWYYKGAKMCLHWPVWARSFPEAKWIIVRRDSNDIVRSCLKTNFMRAHGNKQGWLGWVDRHKDRFLEMEAAELDIKYVWPQKMVDRDFTEMRKIVEWVGLKWNDEKVKTFIEPALWSGKGIKKNA